MTFYGKKYCLDDSNEVRKKFMIDSKAPSDCLPNVRKSLKILMIHARSDRQENELRRIITPSKFEQGIAKRDDDGSGLPDRAMLKKKTTSFNMIMIARYYR